MYPVCGPNDFRKKEAQANRSLRSLSKETPMKQFGMTGILSAALLLSGCGIDKDAAPNFAAGNIQIMYDRDAIAEKEEAAVYSAVYYQADSSSVQGRLLQYDIVGTELTAVGRSIHTEEAEHGAEEYLIIYDGGEEMGVYSGVYGGFSYLLLTPDRKDYSYAVSYYPGHPDNVAQIQGSTFMEDFATDRDLDFMTAEEAAEMLETVAAECGLPEMQVERIYSLDAETLQEHYRLAGLSENWEKSDEAYLIHLTQMIDGIPMMNHSWHEDGGSGRIGACGVLSEDGILSVVVSDVVAITGEAEKQMLLSAEAAEEILRARYEEAVYLSDVCAEAMELRYVIQQDKNQLKLTPAWVICMSRDFIREQIGSGEPVTVKEYEHCVINAVTGELIESGEVQK